MGLADDLRSLPRRRPGLEGVLSTLKEEDAAELLAILLDDNVAAPAICRALRNNGYDIADSTVVAWRRRHRT